MRLTLVRLIEGARYLREIKLTDMKINSRSCRRPVAQKQLDMVKARSCLNQMSGKGMPQTMDAYRLRYARTFLRRKENLSYRGEPYVSPFLLSLE